MKKCFILPLQVFLFLIFLISLTKGQKISEGYFKDWNFGPNVVYGNLAIKDTLGNKFVYIKKISPTEVLVSYFNPHGVRFQTTTLYFKNNSLQEIDERNEWGDLFLKRTFISEKKNVFRVMDQARGINNYLPAKFARYRFKNQLLIEIRYYSFQGKLTDIYNGLAIVRFKNYKDRFRLGELKKTSFFDVHNRPVLAKNLEYHTVLNTYDQECNKTSERFLDTLNELMILQRVESAGVKYAYNTYHQIIRQEYLDLKGKLKDNINGIAYSKNEYSHFDLVRSTRFNIENKRASTNALGDGISSIQNEYDKNGNPLKTSFLGILDNAVQDNSGIHEVQRKFDSRNRLIQISFFGSDHKPKNNRDSIQSMHYKKDSLGRIIEVANYNANGSLVKEALNQVNILRFQYDSLGRVNREWYYADSTLSMPAWMGNYSTIKEFNQDGLIIRYTYLDERGIPKATKTGASVNELLYDGAGRIRERRFLDKDSLILSKLGLVSNFGAIQYKFDSLGRVSEINYLGSHHENIGAIIRLNKTFITHKIIFHYKGNKIISEDFYLPGHKNSFFTLDCLKNDYVTTSGINLGYKNFSFQ